MHTKTETFDQHLFLSKSEAAIHYGSHYHRQRSLTDCFTFGFECASFCADLKCDAFRVKTCHVTWSTRPGDSLNCVACDLPVSRDQATRPASLGRVHINSARATSFGGLCLQLSSVAVIHSTFRVMEIT